MKKQFFTKSGFISITLLAALQAAPAIVSADVSSNVSASSNYLFRGVTQTDGAAAVQGGLDYVMSMRRASTPVAGVPMSILVTAPAMSLIFMPDSPALWKNWVMTLGTFIGYTDLMVDGAPSPHQSDTTLRWLIDRLRS
jgi:hypothetical protein